MRSIYKKLEIKPELLVLFFLAFISGLFRDVLIFFLIIFVHEIGHITSSLLYDWKIKKISFGICGGFITYEERIDKSFKEEFLIAVSGFLFQTLFYLISFFLYKNGLLDSGLMVLIQKYHYSIFIFNLLPIIPLDGSKIINVLLNTKLPFKKSLKITSVISFITIILMGSYMFFSSIKMEFCYVMILFFLIKKIVSFYKDIPHLFNRFLFERYAYPNKCKKINIINGYYLERLRRQKKHVFIIGKKRYKEREILSKIFD